MSAYRSLWKMSARRAVVAATVIASMAVLFGAHAPVALATSERPADLEAPEIEVVTSLAVGGTLSCYPGDWTGVVNQSEEHPGFTYEWLANGVPIASGRTYRITPEAKGKLITCVVTGHGEPWASNTEWEESWNGVEVAGSGGTGKHGSPPENKEAPKVEGPSEAAAGEPLTCKKGTWTGSPTPTYTYVWLRDGTAITGATAEKYVLVEADEGNTITCRVTASNGEGSPVAVLSSNSIKVKGSPPKATEPPEVLGPAEPALGESLTCSEGSWEGDPTPTLTVQWLRGGQSIEGATGKSYVIQEADETSVLSCEVTGSNGEKGSPVTAKSRNSVKVLAGLPENTTPPEVSGGTHVGEELTCAPGKWKGLPAPAYEYQWARDGVTTVITTARYKITEADEGHSLVCTVFAKNERGTGDASSKAVVIPGTEPSDRVAPTLSPSGRPAVGQTLTCSPGEWRGAPAPTYSYEWELNKAAIASATADAYTVLEEDELQQLTCVVRAKNSAGEGKAEVSVTVAGSAPTNRQLPTIAGTPSPGETLTCEPGQWNGEPAPSKFTYQWALNGKTISEATQKQLLVEKGYEGGSLVCEVSATNSEGTSKPASSKPVVVTAKAEVPPRNLELPSVQPAHPVRGNTAKCERGKWSPETATFTYQWMRNGAPIEGATQQDYTVATADQAQSISCVVTATDSEGVGSAESAAVQVAGEGPKDAQAPRIEGNPVVGEALTCEPGTWTGAPSPTFTYEWILAGKAIQGARSQSYVVVAEDGELSLSCKVTASNGVGSASETSAARSVPGEKPSNVVAPLVSAPERASIGSELSCGEGQWRGAPAPTLTYSWRLGADVIEGATGKTYKAVEADAGASISCVVLAINGSGHAEVQSSNAIRIYGTAPAAVSPPTLSPEGDAAVGDTVTCSPGSWSGSPAPVFAYQWLRDGKPVQHATSSSYVVSAADVGASLVCEVSATSPEGGASERSAAIEVIGSAPEKKQAPTIKAPENPAVGDTLECLTTASDWTGNPEPELRFEWLRGAGGEGAVIPREEGSTYKIQPIDRGYWVACRVVATNNAGQETGETRRVHIAGIAPENVEAPRVSGTPAVGETLKCFAGTWEAAPTPKFEYQWLLDGAPIDGATASRYSVQPSQLGDSIACQVTAVNSENSVTETSNSVTVTARPTHQFETYIKEPVELVREVVKSDQPTAAQILAALSKQLESAQKRARLSKLLKAGEYKFSFLAPTSGTLEVLWYEVAHGAQGAKKKPRTVLARAKVVFADSASETVVLRLTRAGRRLLRREQHVKLSVKAIFGSDPPVGPVTWAKVVPLAR